MVSVRPAAMLAASTVILGLFARPSTAQTTLEIQGGTIGEFSQIAAIGPPAKPFYLFFSFNEGPTPLSLLDGFDPRVIEVGLDLFPSLSLSGTLPAVFNFQIPNDTAFVPLTLYAQFVTLPGTPPGLFQDVSNVLGHVIAEGSATVLNVYEKRDIHGKILQTDAHKA